MFLTEANIQTAGMRDGRPLYRLLEDLPVRFGSRFDLVVPAGFLTDFASVPRFLWAIFPPAGPYTRAAIVHDYLYSDATMSRMLADAIFRDLMCWLGVPLWQRWLMWFAVRLFGRPHFGRG